MTDFAFFLTKINSSTPLPFFKKFRFRENGCVLLFFPRLNDQLLFIVGFFTNNPAQSGRYLASTMLHLKVNYSLDSANCNLLGENVNCETVNYI
jgi:hypothetical protein